MNVYNKQPIEEKMYIHCLNENKLIYSHLLSRKQFSMKQTILNEMN